VRSNTSYSSGKHYLEFLWTHSSGGCTFCGVGTQNAPWTDVLCSANGAAFTAPQGGQIWINGTRMPSSVWIGGVPDGGTIGVALDIDHSRIWFRVNNGPWNNQAANDPAANIGGLDVSGLFPAHPAYAMLTLNNGFSTANPALVNGVFSGGAPPPATTSARADGFASVSARSAPGAHARADGAASVSAVGAAPQPAHVGLIDSVPCNTLFSELTVLPPLPNMAQFQEAVMSGVLELPFQFTYTVVIG
jgi:hypothetical protein